MSARDRLVAERYRIESRLGSGAMGVVWKAWDERLNRTVAIKELHLRHSFDEADVAAMKRRAIREGRITAKLMHRHAIAVFDVVEQDDRPCLVMEYLASRSLEAVLAEQGTLPVAEVAKLGADVAAALAAAHDARIVHRDVKPGNVLVGEDITKITDFGISRALGDASTTGVLAGTPAYLAPEVAQGGQADFHTDVFSLGSTLYAALEGRPPFGLGENSIALLHRVAAGEFEPPADGGPLTPVVMRMLATDPAQRPTMRQAQQALAAVAEGAELPESFTAIPLPEPAKPALSAAAWSTSEQSAVPSQAVLPVQPTKRAVRRFGLNAMGTVLVIGAGVLAAVVTGLLTADQIVGPPDPPQPPPAARPAPAPAPEKTPQSVVSDYYAQMPDHLDQAWQQLTPDYQTNHAGGYDAFEEFWDPVTSVRATNVTTTGPRTAQATITYHFDDGRVVTEKTRYTLTADWKIAATTVLSSTGG